MINKKDNHVEWVLLTDELHEAKEHLEQLTTEMFEDDDFDEDAFAVMLGHIYAHLNRAWNCRSSEKGITEEDWDEISKFPTDIEPIG